MLSTKRPSSPDSAPGPTKKKVRTSRRAAVNHSTKVRASTLHVSSSGRIGRKKLKVEKEVLPPSPIDAEPNRPTSPVDNPEPLSFGCELDSSIFDGQEIPSKPNEEKNSPENKKTKKSNTNLVNFLLSFFVHLFLILFID